MNIRQEEVRPRVLVAIASYGTKNDEYLRRLVWEYRSMPYTVDIVLLSNIRKEVAPDIEVIVGLPDRKNPWTLPFGHKAIFAERVNAYDLFIYSEDDTLITNRNIRAFLEVSAKLSAYEIPGFLRKEIGPHGDIYYPDVHWNFHWDPMSVKSVAGYTFGFFTNEHAACYLLTRDQLQRAIASGGFVVSPHQEKYDLLCTAATDPYTQCGLRKVICISHVNDFLVHHLPNKYVGQLGISDADFCVQIEAMLKISRDGDLRGSLLRTDTKLKGWRYAKDYYEPVRPDVTSLVPSGARTVLSIGCGWGATETSLSAMGKRVVAVPIDPIIAACAGARGVEVVTGDIAAVKKALAKERFDCLLVSNVLHLTEDPVSFLAAFTPFMSNTSEIILQVPNLFRIPVFWRKVCGDPQYKTLGDFNKSGVLATSRIRVRRWLRDAGWTVRRFQNTSPVAEHRSLRRLLRPWTEEYILAVGRKARSSTLA